MFFENQNTEGLREWHKEQLAQKNEKLVTLTKEVNARTASLKALPVVTVYSDAEGFLPLTSGIKGKGTILIFAWSKELPKTVYLKDSEDDLHLHAFELAKPPVTEGALVVYRKTSSDLVDVAPLPEFGHFDLQLVVSTTPIESGKDLAVVYLGDYTDGHLEIPVDKIASLQKEVGKEQTVLESLLSVQDAFVLLKSRDGYLPVAVLKGAHHELYSLESLPSLSGLTQKLEKKKFVATGSKEEEKFYVLETPYQQLVFSNYGGP